MLIDSICNAVMTVQDEELETKLMQALVEMAKAIYPYLSVYLGQLGGLTNHLIEHCSEQPTKSGIEFWSQVCNHELRLIEQEKLDPNNSLMRANREVLVQIFQNAVMKNIDSILDQINDDQGNMWNISQSVCCCLELMT